MPAKKATKTTVTDKVEKAAVAKADEVKKEEKTAVSEKKPAVKKAAVKKTTAKKPAAKKTAAKKPAAKKAAPVEEPKREYKSFQTYKDIINWKKWEAHNKDWLYIEVNAGDLLTEVEAGADNMETCVNAILDCMLEGDCFINRPAEKVSKDLTVRYYCDNLAESRRKYFDVNPQ